MFDPCLIFIWTNPNSTNQFVFFPNQTQATFIFALRMESFAMRPQSEWSCRISSDFYLIEMQQTLQICTAGNKCKQWTSVTSHLLLRLGVISGTGTVHGVWCWLHLNCNVDCHGKKERISARIVNWALRAALWMWPLCNTWKHFAKACLTQGGKECVL